ncbi:hypothetical protein E3A20_06580 [Planctomyces bekefii]|uniref:Uncharacterized protein n=1 Tax=Planctomyces bekefii TaxID=1653850 RepID=A0A5C6M8U5_9PLAN|nr:hypothetical protein E3A20_06580 [Planctomyces bekefii]
MSRLGAILLFSLGLSTNSYALNCQQVRQLVGVYFKMHFSNREFNDELSRRTLDSLIKSWDPG